MTYRLPSLHALRAFEAAARTGGFKHAAAELHVTPTAVSHHVRGLEQDLELQLFHRRTRKVELTEAGERLAKTCQQAFASIGETVSDLRQDKQRPIVTIALGPLLASHWLTRRLPGFWERFPGVDLRLLHTSVRIEPGIVDADIFLAWGQGHWPGMTSRPFLSVAGTPVAAPDLLERMGRPDDPDGLRGYPLIHQRDRSAWRNWFDAAGVLEPPYEEGIVIEDANVVLQSALEGQGVAMGWLPLLEPEIRSGRLVRLFDEMLVGRRVYHLITPSEKQSPQIVHDVAGWLFSQIAEEDLASRP